MYQSRLVQHIRELPAKQRERFRQFVHSPYYNQHDKTQELLSFILKKLDKRPSSLSKERVFKALFPGEPYEEQPLYNVMSYLNKLYYKFMAVQFTEKQRYQESLFTLEEAFDNHQFDIMTNRGKQLRKRLDKDPVHDSEYFMASYRLNHAVGYYSGHYFDRAETNTFQQMLDDLDKYYIVEKLRNCCHLTANSLILNTSYEFQMLNEVLAHIQANWGSYHAERSIVLYYTGLMSMLEEQEPNHYQRMKSMLDREMKHLSEKEGRDLYSFAYNYCIRMINAGESAYQLELFNLYKQGLRQDLLLDKGMISEWDYKNIATLGARLKAFEWTEAFLHEYRGKLPPHRQENAYNYNLGNLYYNKQMYEEALSALLLVQFTDVKYHLSTTFLLLRTYYALQDTEALLSLIETFRIYVIRNRKMTVEQKRGYTNFLRFAKKLVLLKHNAAYSKRDLGKELESLKDKVEATENVINKYWLLEECQVAAQERAAKP
ncbi:hypothetical protein [Phaeodactylibacter luteus]|uniref:Tetratricopeptide repeat protein n=1 Tax=Phaeodactylibacter luteus TaxID=1564516 RepID=A0A5C6RP00_9BACT|nr:hypothetical protein [Phaeodactylibacter luteus]TXB63122.1 hypothetical protein FRY97_10715 [Phaeodactylibacter luteus]